MPIPKPRKGENHQDFMGRCMGDTTMNTDYPKNPQRAAVCYSSWRDMHGTAGVGNPPKAAAPAQSMPTANESFFEFMSRCTNGGDGHAACMAAWAAKPRPGASPKRSMDAYPSPGGGEPMTAFVSRCLVDPAMLDTFPDKAERQAVCNELWVEEARDSLEGDQGQQCDQMGQQGDQQGGGGMMAMSAQPKDSGGKSLPAPALVERDAQIKWMPTMLQVKGLNEGERTIMGIASTPSVDHVGDIVESMGAKYKLPIPLLWMHRHDQPVGTVSYAQPTKDGIPFQAKIAKVEEPGKLKDRVDEAWQSVRAGLVKGVSIGFSPIKDQFEMIKGGGIRFKEWNWHELSLVVVPAQADATIQVIRSLDQQAIKATRDNAVASTTKNRLNVSDASLGGRDRPLPSTLVSPNPPGATGRETSHETRRGTTMARTINEDIASYAATLNAHQTKMNEMMDKASEEGVTFDDDQEREYDELKDKCAQIMKHLDRLREREKSNVNALVPVVDNHAIGSNAGLALRQRTAVEVRRPPLEKGTAFCRYVAAVAMSKGNLFEAAQIAQRDAWRDTPEVSNVLSFACREGTTQITKTAINPSTTFGAGDVQGTANWADPLVQYQYMAGEFIDYLRGNTILDKISGGMRRVPFNVRIPLQSSGTTGYWVGEGSSKPMSEAAFTTTTMTFAKVAALVAFTNESLRFSNPGLESMMRADLSAALAYRLDYDLLDTTKTAGTGVGGPSPASLTNGVSAVTATGTDDSAAFADIRSILSTAAGLNLNMAGGVWVMHPSQSIAFSLMLNSLGNRVFPDINPEGGTLQGYRVITSTNVPSSGGSPTDGYMMAFIIPSEILLADDGNVTIDASNQASLQFNTAPDSPASASTVYRSLWQENMTALLAEREITWKKRRTGVVSYIDYAKYR